MKETSSCAHLSLNAEAEGYGFREAGAGVLFGFAVPADTTEAVAFDHNRGTLPPDHGRTVDLLDLAVSSLIVGVLTSLAGL